MALSSWICTNNTKNMLVKIVHPGGHVELHDRPILAAEIMVRNPRCRVTHPNIFQKPWSLVSPETTLMPGQKFYLVPITTIRKLQRLSLKHSPYLAPQEIESDESDHHKDDQIEKNYGLVSKCWLFRNKNSPNKEKKQNNSNDGCSSEENCFQCLLTGMKIKGGSEDSNERTSSSSNSLGSSETKELKEKGVSPKRLTLFDQWQPGLESVTEESK